MIAAVLALTTLSYPLGAPPPSSTPSLTVAAQATICDKYCDGNPVASLDDTGWSGLAVRPRPGERD